MRKYFNTVWMNLIFCFLMLLIFLILFGTETTNAEEEEITPRFVGDYKDDGWILDVIVRDNHAFIADRDYGLLILNLTNKSSPTKESHLDLDGGARGIALSGDYVYIGNVENGLSIIDVSNVKKPKLASQYDTDGEAHGVAVDGEFAYICDHDYGL